MDSLLSFYFLRKKSRDEVVFKMLFKTVFLNFKFINGPVA